MIDMTVKEILQAEAALDRLGTLRLPTPTAFHLFHLLRKVKPYAEDYRKVKELMILELGAARAPTQAERDAGVRGSITEVTEANWKEFETRLKDLELQTVTVGTHQPLTRAMFGAIDLCAGDLFALGPLLVDETEPAPAAATTP